MQGQDRRLSSRPADAPSATVGRAGDRLIWVDALKGFGIILVVLGHALRGIDARHLIDETLFEALDTRIYAFHMPLFFVISGLFLAGTLARVPPPAYGLRLLTRILYPMVLWTYLFLGAKVLVGDMANMPVGAGEIMRLPVPGYAHLWFLWALFLVQGVVLLARLVLGRVDGMAFGLGLLAFALALRIVPLPEPLTPWIIDGVRHLPYLAIGMILGAALPGLAVPRPAALACAGLFLALVLAAPWTESPLVLPAAITVCLVVAAVGLGQTALARWLAPLGAVSMAIYMTHTLFSAGLREALLALGVTQPALHLGLGTVIGLAAPILLYRLADRAGLSRWLGLG